MTKKVDGRGFTLLEILLVVGIIAILAGIVILAINPTKQLGDARNAQRRSDVLTIINGIYQYALDEGHAISDLGLTAGDDTCDATDNDASILADHLVTASSTYLTAIPTDPTDASETDTSEYYVDLNTTGRVTVCAPNAENGVTIEVTR